MLQRLRVRPWCRLAARQPEADPCQRSVYRFCGDPCAARLQSDLANLPCGNPGRKQATRRSRSGTIRRVIVRWAENHRFAAPPLYQSVFVAYVAAKGGGSACDKSTDHQRQRRKDCKGRRSLASGVGRSGLWFPPPWCWRSYHPPVFRHRPAKCRSLPPQVARDRRDPRAARRHSERRWRGCGSPARLAS